MKKINMKKINKLKEDLNNKSKGQQLGILITICAVIMSVMCVSGCNILNNCSGCTSNCFGYACSSCASDCFGCGGGSDKGCIGGCASSCAEGCATGCVAGCIKCS